MVAIIIKGRVATTRTNSQPFPAVHILFERSSVYEDLYFIVWFNHVVQGLHASRAGVSLYDNNLHTKEYTDFRVFVELKSTSRTFKFTLILAKPFRTISFSCGTFLVFSFFIFLIPSSFILSLPYPTFFWISSILKTRQQSRTSRPNYARIQFSRNSRKPSAAAHISLSPSDILRRFASCGYL